MPSRRDSAYEVVFQDGPLGGETVPVPAEAGWPLPDAIVASRHQMLGFSTIMAGPLYTEDGSPKLPNEGDVVYSKVKDIEVDGIPIGAEYEYYAEWEEFSEITTTYLLSAELFMV